MAEANEDEKLSKKELKKKEKEAKKASKKANKDSENISEEEMEESVGSKLLVVFVGLLIVIIWLGIIAICIKSDVGGIGSEYLYPVLKDVPYVNKILPEVEGGINTENTEYPYDSLDEAIQRIKELEIELDNLTNSGTTDAKRIIELEQEIQNLMVYKEEQAKFEEVKEKFYEEVVFSDNAPDINEYKTFYESIAPENAEVLYKRVIEQINADKKIQEYVITYSSMKPKEAAAIFDSMTNDLQLVAKILTAMDTESRAAILGKMNVETAAKLTEIMNPK